MMEADLLKAVLGLGPGGIMAAYATYLAWQDRQERKELQARFTKLLEDTVASRHDLASALEKIADKVGA